MAQDLTRRSLLQKAAVGTALAWTAPVITSLNSPAYAANGSPCTVQKTDKWKSFSFSGTGSTAVSVSVNGGGSGRFVDVTDGYLTGDIFEIFADGVSCGTTTTVPNLGTGVWTDDADTAYADPRWSSGRFYVAPKTKVTITIVVVASPWGSGGAFYRTGKCA